MTTKEIAKEIQDLIDSEVKKQTPDARWKEHYEEVMSDLTHELSQAEAAIQDFKDDNLPINAIEAEGYRRCLQNMLDRFNRWTAFEELN